MMFIDKNISTVAECTTDLFTHTQDEMLHKFPQLHCPDTSTLSAVYFVLHRFLLCSLHTPPSFNLIGYPE